MLLSNSPETVEISQAAGKPELASTSVEAGQRLAEAQSADHAWRTSLVLGLYRRLQWLRRFERGVQYTGAGIGTAFLLAFFGSTFFPDGSPAYDRLLISLIVGAVGSSGGGLIATALIAWGQGRARAWITRAGLAELMEAPEQPGFHVPSSAIPDWICPDCWAENLGTAPTCAICERHKPTDEVRTRLRDLLRVIDRLLPRLLSGAVWLLLFLVFFGLLVLAATSL